MKSVNFWIILFLVIFVICAAITWIMKVATGDGIFDYFPSVMFGTASLLSLFAFLKMLRQQILINKINSITAKKMDEDSRLRLRKIIKKLSESRRAEARAYIAKQKRIVK